jgi:hypothetical protein
MGRHAERGRPMINTPNECRARAAYCAEVAAETTSTIVRKAFSDLARQWTKLATDIEMAVVLRRELEADHKSDGSGMSPSSL